MLGLIPRPVHGVMDYLWSTGLFAAPQLFGFSDDERAVLFCRTKAGTAFAMSLFTRYELGLIKVLPMTGHLVLDGISGAMFCGAPLLFPEEETSVTGTLVALGLFELGVTLTTETEPS